MTYHVKEHDVCEISVEKRYISPKMGERHEVRIHSTSGTIELYLTDEQIDAIRRDD